MATPSTKNEAQREGFIGSFGMQAARYPEILSPELMVGETLPLERAGEVLASMGGYETVCMPVIIEF